MYKAINTGVGSKGGTIVTVPFRSNMAEEMELQSEKMAFTPLTPASQD